MSTSEITHDLGISFLREDIPLNDLQPSSIDGVIYSRVHDALAHSPPPTDLTDLSTYHAYLARHFADMARLGIPIPHKARVQLEMSQLGINEATTRIIPASDFATVIRYTLDLLSSGAKEVWWGTAQINDFTDPQGTQTINPPLYRGIRNFTDILLNLACAFEFAQAHPNTLLKVFPQDKPHPTIGSLVASETDLGGKWLQFKFRPGEYTTSARKPGDDAPILIGVDYTHDPPIISTNQNERVTLEWLNVILRSRHFFRALDKIDFCGSDYLNPEFLILPSPDSDQPRIAFIMDVIFGSHHQPKNRCPKIASPLAELAHNLKHQNYLLLPTHQSNLLTSPNDYLWGVLATLKSFRTPHPDSLSARTILQTQGDPRFAHLPDLPLPLIRQLERMVSGQPPQELTETLMDLENHLLLPELEPSLMTDALAPAIFNELWHKLIALFPPTSNLSVPPTKSAIFSRLFKSPLSPSPLPLKKS